MGSDDSHETKRLMISARAVADAICAAIPLHCNLPRKYQVIYLQRAKTQSTLWRGDFPNGAPVQGDAEAARLFAADVANGLIEDIKREVDYWYTQSKQQTEALERMRNAVKSISREEAKCQKK